MSTRTWRLVRTATVTVILAAGLVACGNATAPGTGGTPSNPATSPSSAPPAVSSPTPGASQSTTPRASAADQLAGFFAAAEVNDGRLRHAAALANEGIGKTSINLSPDALAAIQAVNTAEVARTIPAGLPTELLRRTLLVYSDLQSRRIPLLRLQGYSSGHPLQLSSQDGKYVYGCLGNGARAAARFGADLAGLRALALATEPVTVAAPDSRAAAELALRLESIDKRNSGCGECGGWIATTLSHIVWQPKDEEFIGHSDGYIDGVRFRATYHAGSGWEVMTWAC